MHKNLELAKEKALHLKERATRIKEKVGENTIYFVSLIPILLIGLYVRTRNLKWLQGKYLLGLDPYLFYRYAGYILEYGKLMAVDTIRYIPLGYKPSPTDIFFSTVLAYGYKLVAWTGIDRITFHIWYPAVAGIIGFIFLFLFVRELFGNKVALISTAFAAVIPALIYRTGAGFADHEAIALVWMFASLWLFAKAWKSEKLGRYIAFSTISGLLAGFMILTWGGYKFLVATVGIFMVLMLMFSKLKDEQILTYFCWFVMASAFMYIRARTIYFITSYEFLILAFAALACIIYLIITKLKLPVKIDDKLTYGAFSLIASALIGLIAVIATGVISLSALYGNLIHPTGASRLSFSVSENAQPYFIGRSGWMASFGPTIFLLLAGAIVLFYLIFKGEKKYSILLTFGWVATLITFVFGKYEAGSEINKFFSGIYLYVLAAFVFMIIGIYFYTYIKDKANFGKLFNADWRLLLVFSWFIFSLIIARGSVRTIMALVPVAAVIVGFFMVKSVSWFWSKKLRVFAILLCVFAVFCFVSNAQASEDISIGSGSGYPGQWESAMHWLKTSTPKDSVIAHWWDYGYWTQTMGERASVVDGGNTMGWDHQMGRYGLLGRNPEKYLTYLKTHKVTHLLISEEEIGKFYAFSTIGSDENFDLQSTIGIFSLQQEKEIRNGSQLVYGGSWSLDKDYLIGSKVLQQGTTYIAGFVLDLNSDDALINLQVIFYDGTNRYEAPLKCTCYNGSCQTMNPDGFGGCLVFAPYIVSNTDVRPLGAAFFVSEKIEDTTLVNLYLKGAKSEYFTEVYNDGTPLGIYGGHIIGPIRIWKINYPEWVETDEKYLERSDYG